MHPETSLWGSSRKHTMVPGSPGPISSFHSLIENPSKPHPKLQEAPGLLTPDTACRTLLVRGAQQSPTPAAQHSPVQSQPSPNWELGTVTHTRNSYKGKKSASLVFASVSPK